MSDQYEVISSLANQENDFTFKRKYNMRIPDTNSGSYPSSQINFNLSSLTTNNAFLSCKQSSLEIPYVVRVTSTVALGTAAQNTYMVALKKSVADLVNGISVQLNENSIINFADLSNLATQFKILSTWSEADVLVKGDIINWAKNNASAYGYNDGAGSIEGVGEYNNTLLTPAVEFTPASGLELGLGSVPNVGMRKRAQKTSYNAVQTELAKFSNTTHAQNAHKAYYDQVSTTSIFYYMMVTVPLTCLHDLFEKLPLIRNPYFKMTIQVHTATAVIPYTHAGTLMGLTSVSSSFNYNPIMVSKATNGFTGTADAVITIKSGIASVDSSSAIYGGHTCYFNACLYEFNPDAEAKYIDAVGNKLVRYQDVYSNRLVNSTGAINWQIHTGIAKIRGLLIVTNLGSGVNCLATPATAVGAGTSVLLSPFTSGENMLGCSFTNMNIKIGGVPHYQENINYSYDIFKNEVMSYNSVNGGLSNGVCSGLISQNDFESGVFAYTFVDLSRKPRSEDDLPKTIHFCATNNSLASALDLTAFVFYENNLSINVDTSQISL